MMTIKERRDRKPILVKLGLLGVGIALSFAGRYLYSPPPPVSEYDNEVDDDGRSRIEDDHQTEVDAIDAFESGDLSLTFIREQLENLRQENRRLAETVTELTQRLLDSTQIIANSQSVAQRSLGASTSTDPSSSNIDTLIRFFEEDDVSVSRMRHSRSSSSPTEVLFVG